MRGALVLVTLGSLGCGFDLWDSEDDWDSEGSWATAESDSGRFYDTDATSFEVHHVDIAGNFGVARGLEGNVSHHTSWSGIVETYAEDRVDGWAAMTAVSFYGEGLGYEGLVPGARFQFGQSYFGDAYTPFAVEVLGCSGPAMYDWVYDDYATEVEVVVDDPPAAGQLQLTYHARWSTGDVVTGTFVVEVTSTDNADVAPYPYY